MSCPICDELRNKAKSLKGQPPAVKAWHDLVLHQTRDHVLHMATPANHQRPDKKQLSTVSAETEMTAIQERN